MPSARKAGTAARRRAAGGQQDKAVACQVPGCAAHDLRKEPKPAYSIKRRLCSMHIKADAVRREGHGDCLFRFCFQCGKLEPLAAFSGARRSCSASLQLRREAATRGDADRSGADQQSHAAAAASANNCGLGGSGSPAAAPGACDCTTHGASVQLAVSPSTAAASASAGLAPFSDATADPPSSQPPSFCAASAAAELAGAFCDAGALDVATEAAFAGVADSLSSALLSGAGEVAAGGMGVPRDDDELYEALVAQLLSEIYAADAAGPNAAGPAATITGSASTAHMAPPPPVAGVRALALLPPAASAPVPLAACALEQMHAARLQHLQACFGQLQQMLSFVCGAAGAALAGGC